MNILEKIEEENRTQRENYGIEMPKIELDQKA